MRREDFIAEGDVSGRVMFFVIGDGFSGEDTESDTDGAVVEVMDGAFDLSGRNIVFPTGCSKDEESRVRTMESFWISGEEDIVNGVFHLDWGNG